MYRYTKLIQRAYAFHNIRLISLYRTEMYFGPEKVYWEKKNKNKQLMGN